MPGPNVGAGVGGGGLIATQYVLSTLSRSMDRLFLFFRSLFPFDESSSSDVVSFT